MSAGVIRKNDVSGITPWEMEAFSDPEQNHGGLPTVDQIDRLHQSAHDEGFQNGYREGLARAQSEAANLVALHQGFESEFKDFDQQIAESVLQFSLTLSQAVLRTSLDHRPELMLPLVREALAELPTQGEARQRQLHLHPDDAALISQHGGDLTKASQLEIIEDARIERGGCKLRTAHAETDATLPTRWMHALAALGRSDAWLSGQEPQETDTHEEARGDTPA